MIRKWHEGHNKGMEFRCYVSGGTLLGIVQKDDTATYPFLADKDLLATVFKQIHDLLDTKVKKAL